MTIFLSSPFSCAHTTLIHPCHPGVFALQPWLWFTHLPCCHPQGVYPFRHTPPPFPPPPLPSPIPITIVPTHSTVTWPVGALSDLAILKFSFFYFTHDFIILVSIPHFFLEFCVRQKQHLDCCEICKTRWPKSDFPIEKVWLKAALYNLTHDFHAICLSLVAGYIYSAIQLYLTKYQQNIV